MLLFQDIEDHRVDVNKDYELADIIFLTITAMLCGSKNALKILDGKCNQVAKGLRIKAIKAIKNKIEK